jgi:hypothetical protein
LARWNGERCVTYEEAIRDEPLALHRAIKTDGDVFSLYKIELRNLPFMLFFAVHGKCRRNLQVMERYILIAMNGTIIGNSHAQERGPNS